MPASPPHRRRTGGVARVAAVGAALVLALAACDSAPPAAPTTASPTATKPVTSPVVVNTRTLPTGLLPADARDPDTVRIAGLLWRGLVRYDAKGKTVMEVATSIETSDNTVYTVHLDPGWRFSDGEHVTAASFVEAWNFAARPGSRQYRANSFAPILGYEAVRAATGRAADLAGLAVVDDRTFTITLSQPQPGFVDSLGDPAFAPLPAAALRDPAGFAKAPVGNGPYSLDGSWQATELRLRPSAAYRGTDAARNAGLVMRAYTDLDAAYADLVAGRLDVLDDVPVAKLATYHSDLGDRAVDQPVGLAQSIVVPLRRPEWQGAAGLARRTALSTAIDRATVSTTVLARTRLPATDLAAPIVEGSSQSLCAELCAHDVDAAKKALNRAGGLGGPLQIAYAADLGDRPWLDAVCADIAQALSTTCTPKAYPTSLALRAAVAAGTETSPYVDTWQMSRPALAAFLVPRFVSGAPQNGSGYSDDVVDTELGTAATAPAASQAAAYQHIEQTVLEALPVIPLWSVNATFASAPGVEKVRSDVFGSPVFTEITRQ